MKRRCIRLFCAALALLLLAGWLVPPVPAEAAGDSLKVYVAYWGQNHAEPILKKTYSRSGLASLGTVYVQYTAYDRGNRCRYADAEGVLLSDVLYGAGIDFWDADSLHFYTTDEPGGYENPYSLGYLFGDRYAFPLLSQYYGVENGFYDPENPDRTEDEIIEYLWTQCEAVPVMLALRDNYSRVDGYSVFEGGDMYTENSFHLLFGQTSPTNQTSSRHAKWIESIVVLYDHYPELTTDETELNLSKDNTGYKVEVTLADSSVDPDLMADVLGSLEWSTSDSTVVSLEPAGSGVCYLNVHGPGEVTVTVTSDKYYDAGGGRLSLSITIHIGDDEEFGNGDGEGTGDGDGTGDGSGEGEGDAPGDGSGDGNGGEGSEGSGNGEGVPPQTGPTDPEASAPTEPQPPGPSEPAQPSEPTQPAETTPTEPEPPEESTEPTQPESTKPPAVTSRDEEEPEETTPELFVTPQPGDAAPTPSPQPHKLQVQRLVTQAAQAPPDSGQSSGHEGGSQAQILFQENPLITVTIAAAVILFLLGGAGKYITFRRER